MPEIISKNPDLTIALLKETGMQCGTGGKQQFLPGCPQNRFCALSNGKGELCVYTPDEIGSMTQMTSFEFINYGDLLLPAGGLAVLIFLAGMMAGFKLK